jgi:DNA-binding transcriptional ArsR family regulator
MTDGEIAKFTNTLGHPIRIGFLRALRETDKLSPIEFSRQSDEMLGSVSYHVKGLARAGVIEVGETVKRRGALEHRYSLKQPQAKLVFRLLDILTKA